MTLVCVKIELIVDAILAYLQRHYITTLVTAVTRVQQYSHIFLRLHVMYVIYMMLIVVQLVFSISSIAISNKKILCNAIFVTPA